MSDIDVQRDTAESVPNTGTTNTLVTPLGSLTSAFVRNTCNRRMAAGFQLSGANMEVDDLSMGFQLTDVSTIEVGREPASGAITFGAWETWEYTGAASGPNEFIVRGRYQLTLTGESTTQVVPGITNIDRCIPFIQGIFSDSPSDDSDHATAVAWMSGTDTLNISRGSGSADTTRVWVVVVEFTGSDWSVRHGRTQSAADTGSITLVAAADGLTGSADGVSDWADAFITHQFRANNLDGTNDNVADGSATYVPNGLTTVDWAFHPDHADAGTAGNEGIHFVHVLEHASMVVTRIADAGAGFGAQPIDITAAGLTNMATAGVEISRSVSSTTRQYARGWVLAEMISTTVVNIATHRTTGVTDTRLQIIDFENVVTSSSSDLAGTADGVATTGDAALLGSGDLGGSTTAAAVVADADLASGGALVGTADGVATTGDANLTGAGSLGGSAGGTAISVLDNGTSIASLGAVMGYIGNSYTQNYGSMPAHLQYYVNARTVGSTVDLDAVPYLVTSIANSDTDGYFPGMTIGGAADFPNIDQSSGGSTDAVDAVASEALDYFDFVVMTSGFRRDAGVGGYVYEIPDGVDETNENVWGVNLGVARSVSTQLRAVTNGLLILRMTQEGFNANTDTDLTDMDRIHEIQVKGARQLLAEGVVDFVSPDHYLWGRLHYGVQSGSVGSGVTTPVPWFASLTHPSSQQPGGRNYSPLSRSQGDVSPFALNAHQNALATIVHCWLWGYMFWGIDPRGDTTFSSPASLLSGLNTMISPDGAGTPGVPAGGTRRIYGGHNTGAGNTPYDAAGTFSAGLDSNLDFVWSAANQLEIQDRVVAVADDWMNNATEYEPPVEGELAGTTTAGAANSGALGGLGTLGGGVGGAATVDDATLLGSGSMSGADSGSASTQGQGEGSGELAGTSSGAANAAPADLIGETADSIQGITGGSASGSATLQAVGDLSGTDGGSTETQGQVGGDGSLSGTASGTATGVVHPPGGMAGSSTGSATSNPADLEGEGELGGTAAGNAAGSLTLVGDGSLSGSAAGTSTVVEIAQNVPQGPFTVAVKDPVTFTVKVKI